MQRPIPIMPKNSTVRILILHLEASLAPGRICDARVPSRFSASFRPAIVRLLPIRELVVHAPACGHDMTTKNITLWIERYQFSSWRHTVHFSPIPPPALSQLLCFAKAIDAFPKLPRRSLVCECLLSSIVARKMESKVSWRTDEGGGLTRIWQTVVRDKPKHLTSLNFLAPDSTLQRLVVLVPRLVQQTSQAARHVVRKCPAGVSSKMLVRTSL